LRQKTDMYKFLRATAHMQCPHMLLTLRTVRQAMSSFGCDGVFLIFIFLALGFRVRDMTYQSNRNPNSGTCGKFAIKI